MSCADWERIKAAVNATSDATPSEVADAAEKMNEREWQAYCKRLSDPNY